MSARIQHTIICDRPGCTKMRTGDGAAFEVRHSGRAEGWFRGQETVRDGVFRWVDLCPKHAPESAS